jgi:hypothetical protein
MNITIRVLVVVAVLAYVAASQAHDLPDCSKREGKTIVANMSNFAAQNRELRRRWSAWHFVAH